MSLLVWLPADQFPRVSACLEARPPEPRGAICLRISSHFAPIPKSKLTNPVMLPPGRARLSTKPLLTGSTTCANTIGIVLVCCFNAATTSRRYWRELRQVPIGSILRHRPAPDRQSPEKRTSSCMSRPSLQPKSCIPFRNAARRACPSASSSTPISTAMRRARSFCCASASSGSVANHQEQR